MLSYDGAVHLLGCPTCFILFYFARGNMGGYGFGIGVIALGTGIGMVGLG